MKLVSENVNLTVPREACQSQTVTSCTGVVFRNPIEPREVWLSVLHSLANTPLCAQRAELLRRISACSHDDSGSD